jgi:hypothetical protein
MKIVALAAALVLAGCTEPVYMWTKAGPHSFEQDSAACKADIDRRIKATPPNFILKDGAHYQSGKEWGQREYNKCMTTAGYTPSRETTSSEIEATKAPAKPLPAAAVTTPASPASTNMAGRLRELRGLLDQGLVSQAEYDQRRQAILDSM